MKLFIVGASGYIGANLVQHLANAGHDVVAGVRFSNSFVSSQANIRLLDINLSEIDSYHAVISSVDAIIYLVGPGVANRNVCELDLINEYLNPFVVFMNANARANNVPIIFASSGGTVYGNGSLVPFTENDKPKPVSPYGLLKHFMEETLNYFNRSFSTKVIILRISNPYGGLGHLKDSQGVIDVFVKKAVNKECLEVWGDGSAIRDFIHMQDLLRAFSNALSYSGDFSCFNIGSGVGLTISEVLLELKEVLGYQPMIATLEKKTLDLDCNLLNVSLAKNKLAWIPEISISEGLRRTVEIYRG